MVDSTLADTSDAVFSLLNITSVEMISHETPNDFALFQNYPNPFNRLRESHSIYQAVNL